MAISADISLNRNSLEYSENKEYSMLMYRSAFVGIIN